jgi:hypothetical protein
LCVVCGVFCVVCGVLCVVCYVLLCAFFFAGFVQIFREVFAEMRAGRSSQGKAFGDFWQVSGKFRFPGPSGKSVKIDENRSSMKTSRFGGQIPPGYGFTGVDFRISGDGPRPLKVCYR